MSSFIFLGKQRPSQNWTESSVTFVMMTLPLTRYYYFDHSDHIWPLDQKSRLICTVLASFPGVRAGLGNEASAVHVISLGALFRDL